MPLRVLVVDDDPVLLKLARRVLERAGFFVDVAAGGQAGVDMHRVASTPYDVVVLDLAMPGMRGEVAFAVMRLLRPLQAFIVASGEITKEIEHTMSRHGNISFLPKPYGNAQLVDFVRVATA